MPVTRHIAPRRAVLAALSLLCFAATLGHAQTADPNATIFYNVIKGCNNKDPTWTVNNPLANWNGALGCPGASCVFQPPACDGSLNLIGLREFNFFKKLNFSAVLAVGTIDLTTLPTGLAELYLNDNQISGTLDLTSLNSALEILDLSHNKFSGGVNLIVSSSLIEADLSYNAFTGTPNVTATEIQAFFYFLDLSYNALSGPLDFLEKMVTGPQQLYLRGNNFHGPFVLPKLAEVLTLFDASLNEFDGTLDLTPLPFGFQTLDVSFNRFEGTLDLSVAPNTTTLVNVAGNLLSGRLTTLGNFISPITINASHNAFTSLDWASLPALLVTLDISHNKMRGTLALGQLLRLQDLFGQFYASHNQFSGPLDLRQLPITVQLLDVSHNALSGVLDVTHIANGGLALNLNNNNFSGTLDVTTAAEFGYTFTLGNNPFFAVWATPSFNITATGLDPSVRVLETSFPATTASIGVFTSAATKLPLRLTGSGGAALGKCRVTLPWQNWRCANTTGYVLDSGVAAAALAPCLPTSGFGTAEYMLQPTPNTLVFVTNGGNNVTFTRRGG